jgi:Plasmid pRiA4b ORF-3-like protein
MTTPLLQLKLSVADIKPSVWRRLLVPGQITLQRLHEVIQAVAGWSDEHSHEFVIADKRYGRPAPREVVPVYNEALYRLHSLSLFKGAAFVYVYDFSDRWRVEITVERLLPRDPGAPYRTLLGGARAFPPEGSGGPSVYQMLLETASRGVSQDFAADHFDPERFDLKADNERLDSLLAGQL